MLLAGRSSGGTAVITRAFLTLRWMTSNTKPISGLVKGFHGDSNQSRSSRSGGQNQTPESCFPAVLPVRLETSDVHVYIANWSKICIQFDI